MSWKQVLGLDGMMLQDLVKLKDYWRKLLSFHCGCLNISRELGDLGRVSLCLARLVLGRHYLLKLLLLSVVQHFSMFLLLHWLQNGMEKVSAWYGVCLIWHELMHLVQFSLMRLILYAMPGGKISTFESISFYLFSQIKVKLEV
uniref:Uncharacterized protein MANES_04G120400 n=1 Tax=Rhizophora mucronata TaxID=61149 RepID=A0A2P2MFD6_RHIMU